MDGKRSKWDPVKNLMGNVHNIELGRHLSYQLMNSPRNILYAAVYYKFAAKMVGPEARVLDIGCGEGLGTWILARECASAHGVDIDSDAINSARRNWNSDNIAFDKTDFLKMPLSTFDAVVNFDVIEHIMPENIEEFLRRVVECLTERGIAIIGTPNISSVQYTSEETRSGHVNMFSGERLEKEMLKHFRRVFMFGANDEVVHTGFLPMAQYLFAMGCLPRHRR
jgi:2-polyprenyl-3-methyl-5-hydroxy-6-metoxy-1,4-benzoquinol methylase